MRPAVLKAPPKSCIECGANYRGRECPECGSTEIEKGGWAPLAKSAPVFVEQDPHPFWLASNGLDDLAKHLKGGHDQLAHGRRGGQPGRGEKRRDALARITADYQRARGNISDERKAKGEARIAGMNDRAAARKKPKAETSKPADPHEQLKAAAGEGWKPEQRSNAVASLTRDGKQVGAVMHDTTGNKWIAMTGNGGAGMPQFSGHATAQEAVDAVHERTGGKPKSEAGQTAAADTPEKAAARAKALEDSRGERDAAAGATAAKRDFLARRDAREAQAAERAKGKNPSLDTGPGRPDAVPEGVKQWTGEDEPKKDAETPELSDRARAFLERRDAKLQRKQDRYEQWGGNARARSDAAYDKAKQTADGIPVGQPMLTDHYSYRGDRNRRQRMRENFQRSFEEGAKADRYEGKVKAIDAVKRQHETDRGFAERRVKEAEAELRRMDRSGQTTGAYREKQEAKLEAYKAELKRHEGSGREGWSKDHFQPGDRIQIGNRYHEVTRSNPTSVSVKTEHSWGGKLSHDKIPSGAKIMRQVNGEWREVQRGEQVKGDKPKNPPPEGHEKLPTMTAAEYKAVPSWKRGTPKRYDGGVKTVMVQDGPTLTTYRITKAADPHAAWLEANGLAELP